MTDDRGGALLQFRLLGPVQAWRDDQRIDLGSRQQRLVLAVLLLEVGKVVPTDRLITLIWPDAPPPTARNVIQVRMSRLRATLADDAALIHEGDGYRIAVDRDQVDLHRFRDLLDEARQLTVDQRDDDAVAAFAVALSLWAGEPLAGTASPTVRDQLCRGIEEARLVALEDMLAAELRLGRHTGVVDHLSDLARQHPTRERFLAQLMLALYRCQQGAQALDVARTARRRLADELGIDPGQELQELELAILREDPQLAAPVPAPSVPGPAHRSAPAELPRRVGGFVGRIAELEELDSLLGSDDEGIALITGTAGVGKTALAVRWAHLVRDRFPDGQLYVDLRGYSTGQEVSAETAVVGWLRSLGIDGSDLPLGLDERSALLRSRVDGRRILFLIDNARTAEQVRHLLPGTPTCFTVVTSRDALAGLSIRDGAYPIELDRLSHEDARVLIDNALGSDAGAPEAVAALIDRCTRLPLALRIAVDLVRSRPKRGLTGLVSDLAGESNRLDLLEIDEDPDSAVRTVFSWSYQRLAPDVAELFRMAGLIPGRDADRYVFAALADRPPDAVGRGLRALVRAHLLDETDDGRFAPHDLLRAYARELVEQTDDVDAAQDRLIDYYRSAAAQAMNVIAPAEAVARPAPPEVDQIVPTFGDHDTAWGWLRTERANLLSITALPMSVAVLHAHALTLWRFLDSVDHTDDTLCLGQQLVEAGSEHDEPGVEADGHWFIGRETYTTGRYDEARGHLERAVVLHRQSADQLGLARALNSLAGSDHIRGDYPTALRHLEQSIELYDRLEMPSLQPAPLTNVARVRQLLGESGRALDSIDAALRLARADTNPFNEASVLLIRSRILCHLDRVEEAQNCAQLLLRLTREHGIGRLEVAALAALGETSVYLGAYDVARDSLRAAQTMAIARDQHTELVDIFNQLGELALATSDVAGARRHFEAALRQQRGDGESIEAAHSQLGLADVHRITGDRDREAAALRSGRRILDALGLPPPHRPNPSVRSVEDQRAPARSVPA